MAERPAVLQITADHARSKPFVERERMAMPLVFWSEDRMRTTSCGPAVEPASRLSKGATRDALSYIMNYAASTWGILYAKHNAVIQRIATLEADIISLGYHLERTIVKLETCQKLLAECADQSEKVRVLEEKVKSMEEERKAQADLKSKLQTAETLTWSPLRGNSFSLIATKPPCLPPLLFVAPNQGTEEEEIDEPMPAPFVDLRGEAVAEEWMGW